MSSPRTERFCDTLQAARMYAAFALAVPPALVGLCLLGVAGMVVTVGEYPFEEWFRTVEPPTEY